MNDRSDFKDLLAYCNAQPSDLTACRTISRSDLKNLLAKHNATPSVFTASNTISRSDLIVLLAKYNAKPFFLTASRNNSLSVFNSLDISNSGLIRIDQLGICSFSI